MESDSEFTLSMKGNRTIRSVETLCKEQGFNVRTCFQQDGELRSFSIREFMRANRLPEDPAVEALVIETIREMVPEVRIVEEEN